MTKVMFKSPHGSIGKVVNGLDQEIILGTVQAHQRIYVRWCYGVDATGKPICETSGYWGDTHELVVIPDHLYEAYVVCPAWSDEQAAVRERIIAAVFPSWRNLIIGEELPP